MFLPPPSQNYVVLSGITHTKKKKTTPDFLAVIETFGDSENRSPNCKPVDIDHECIFLFFCFLGFTSSFLYWAFSNQGTSRHSTPESNLVAILVVISYFVENCRWCVLDGGESDWAPNGSGSARWPPIWNPCMRQFQILKWRDVHDWSYFCDFFIFLKHFFGLSLFCPQ